MKVLVLWAHPEPASLNGALAALAARTLTEAGHEVRVTDLYRDGFAVAASGEDFAQRQNPARLVYDAEQLAATKGGGFAEEIERSLEDLFWCDLLILQFPLWWFSVPAILKGWIDRVMVKGLTYGGGRWYDRGGLAGRKAMMSITTAAYQQMCAPDGINGDMDVILWPLQHGVLRFVGFEALRPNIIWSAPYSGEDALRAEMDRYRTRLLSIGTEPPEPAPGRSDFGGDWRLLAGVEPVTAGHWRDSQGQRPGRSPSDET